MAVADRSWRKKRQKFELIKRMRERCVPGSLSSPCSECACLNSWCATEACFLTNMFTEMPKYYYTLWQKSWMKPLAYIWGVLHLFENSPPPTLGTGHVYHWQRGGYSWEFMAHGRSHMIQSGKLMEEKGGKLADIGGNYYNKIKE